MQLGGWTRLWVVVVFLYGVLVVLVAYDSRPSASQVTHNWIVEASEVISNAISKAEGQEVEPYKIRDAFLIKDGVDDPSFLERVASSPTQNQKIFSAQVASVNAKYRAQLSALPGEQRTFWFISFAWWLGGAIALFAFGAAIGWVYRGFRRAAA